MQNGLCTSRGQHRATCRGHLSCAVLGTSLQNPRWVFSVLELPSFPPSSCRLGGRPGIHEERRVLPNRFKSEFLNVRPSSQERGEVSLRFAFTPGAQPARKIYKSVFIPKVQQGLRSSASGKSRESSLDTTEPFGGAGHPCGRAGNAD